MNSKLTFKFWTTGKDYIQSEREDYRVVVNLSLLDKIKVTIYKKDEAKLIKEFDNIYEAMSFCQRINDTSLIPVKYRAAELADKLDKIMEIHYSKSKKSDIVVCKTPEEVFLLNSVIFKHKILYEESCKFNFCDSFTSDTKLL